MPTDIPPLTFGNFYHIYNRGNNHEDIFLEERNYDYFLNLWWKHTSPIAETWAYCLLRNHFHVVVYIKDREDLENLTGLKADLSGFKDPSKYFSNFFNAYARGFNISAKRSGALFERPFKRIPVDSTAYLMQLIRVHPSEPAETQVHRGLPRLEALLLSWTDFRYPEQSAKGKSDEIVWKPGGLCSNPSGNPAMGWAGGCRIGTVEENLTGLKTGLSGLAFRSS